MSLIPLSVSTNIEPLRSFPCLANAVEIARAFLPVLSRTVIESVMPIGSRSGTSGRCAARKSARYLHLLGKLQNVELSER